MLETQVVKIFVHVQNINRVVAPFLGISDLSVTSGSASPTILQTCPKNTITNMSNGDLSRNRNEDAELLCSMQFVGSSSSSSSKSFASTRSNVRKTSRKLQKKTHVKSTVRSKGRAGIELAAEAHMCRRKGILFFDDCVFIACLIKNAKLMPLNHKYVDSMQIARRNYANAASNLPKRKRVAKLCLILQPRDWNVLHAMQKRTT